MNDKNYFNRPKMRFSQQQWGDCRALKILCCGNTHHPHKIYRNAWQNSRFEMVNKFSEGVLLNAFHMWWCVRKKNENRFAFVCGNYTNPLVPMNVQRTKRNLVFIFFRRNFDSQKRSTWTCVCIKIGKDPSQDAKIEQKEQHKMIGIGEREKKKSLVALLS